MSGERANAYLIAQPDAFAGDDFPDATQLHVGELFLSRIEHRHGGLARDREQ